MQIIDQAIEPWLNPLKEKELRPARKPATRWLICRVPLEP